VRLAWRRVSALLLGAGLLAGCVTQTRPGPPPPSPAAIEAARRADLRYRAKAHTDLAAAYYERKQYAVALEEAETALQTDSSYAGAWNLRGLIYMALREDRDAEDSFLRGLKVAPNDSELDNNYGFFLCSRGRQRDGLLRLESAIHDPLYQTPEKPLVNAGLCALSVHDQVAAEDYLRRAVRLQPADPQGAYSLAQLLAGKGHPGEAREILRPLLRPDVPPREALALMITLDERLQDPEQLRQHTEMLHKAYPEMAAEPGTAKETRP
jgi:type IV pilus assembly protein PilF